MNLVKSLRKSCSPALFYFIISFIGLFFSSMQNMHNKNKYDLGSFRCNVPSTFIIFVIKFVIILFWTWILNLICNSGHSGIAWFLVLLPFILLFLIVLMVKI